MAFHDLAKVTTPTQGTGTITLGPAVSGFLTFAQAGVIDQETVSYGIFDPQSLASEAGHGIYSAAGGTLTRGPIASSNGGAAINLSGSAIVVLTVLAEDLTPRPVWQVKTASSNNASYTASNNDCLQINTANAPFSVVLPANPQPGWMVRIADYAATFATNNVTVVYSGAGIMGLAQNMTISQNITVGSIDLTYIDAVMGWKIL
jgi:hypothetical protein